MIAYQTGEIPSSLNAGGQSKREYHAIRSAHITDGVRLATLGQRLLSLHSYQSAADILEKILRKTSYLWRKSAEEYICHQTPGYTPTYLDSAL